MFCGPEFALACWLGAIFDHGEGLSNGALDVMPDGL